MAHENLMIEIDGEEMGVLYDDLTHLEVEQPEDLPATFRLEIRLLPESDGTWRHLDDPALRAWNGVLIEGGFDELGREELIRGYITEIEVVFDPEITEGLLTVSGLDASVMMDRDEQLKAWPNKKDSDIVAEIFNRHGFEPVVENTDVVHDEAVATIIQRETDLHFLQRLARRNGFACYVEEGRGFFGAVPGDAKPQPVLAVHFGEKTTLSSFTAALDALRPVDINMRWVDGLDKQVLSASAESGEIAPLGKLVAKGLLPRGMDPSRVYVARSAATGIPEMKTLCQGLHDEGDYFVSAEGEVDATTYEHVLRPRSPVPVKGVGETWSGLYYVSHVRHSFTPDGYSQHFQAKRNALEPLGTEDFKTPPSGGLL